MSLYLCRHAPKRGKDYFSTVFAVVEAENKVQALQQFGDLKGPSGAPMRMGFGDPDFKKPTVEAYKLDGVFHG